MVIYGSKATKLATESIAEKCSNCETQNSIQMSVFQKYAHVFWIPFFPIEKTGVTQCSHCKRVLQKNEFPENLSKKYDAIKSRAKTPFWTFSGLAIVAILVIINIMDDRQSSARNAQIILSPQKGDIYEVKRNYEQYTLYKVEKVTGDTVFLLANRYETNKITGLTDLKNKGDEAYNGNALPILRKDLKTMLDKGEIVGIDRN